MARHFEVVLGAMVADPAQRIDSLPLMDATEREQVVRAEHRCEAMLRLEQCLRGHPAAFGRKVALDGADGLQIDTLLAQLAHEAFQTRDVVGSARR